MTYLKKMVVSASALLLLTACGTATEDAATEDTSVEEPATEQTTDTDNGTVETSFENEFTLEQLSEYDGKDGNPAYVAIDGVVYDVTDNEAWVDGEHAENVAGNDLTSEILGAPHGEDVLEDLTVVGSLVE